MEIPNRFVTSSLHRELFEELLLLDTPEDRLSWLMERKPIHRPLVASERTDERRVPGCLSGLWLTVDIVDSVCYFGCDSDSDLVRGVVSFICDLYSGRTAQEILEIGDLLTRALKLDGLLSVTRRRAVANALAFFQHTALSIAPAECVA